MSTATSIPPPTRRPRTDVERVRLADARHFIEASPRYLPRGTALRMFASADEELVLSGPAGTGKSRAWLEWIHFLMQRYPGARSLIVRKTRVSLNESALFTFEAHVLGQGHPIADGPTREHRTKYLYPNGSEIAIGGLDKPTRLFSTEYDLIYVQEATEATLNEWESLLRALRNGVVPYQQLGGDCNPDKPQHWIKQRADNGVCRMLHAKHEDNPRLYDEDANDGAGDWTEEGTAYLSRLDRLTGPRKQRLRYGKWVGAEGMVYSEWDEALHVLDRTTKAYGLTGDPLKPVPDGWRRVRVVDFGYTNPFVCQWWAIDPDGRAFLYREIYRTQRLVRDHATQITRLSEGESIEATVADHDAEDRATLHAEGIPTLAATKTVTTGIEAVNARLQPSGDGKPRLFILRGSLVETDPDLAEAMKPTQTLEEIPGYVYPKGIDGKPRKEEPVKVDDHGSDAVRYLCMYLDTPAFQSFGLSLPI